MTVSFTKNEIDWLFSFVCAATSDLEDDEFGKQAIDAANKIKEKLRNAQLKR